MKFFVLLAFLAVPQAKSTEKCILSGTVVNALTGAPLNKVRILAEGENGLTPATISDDKGAFTLVDLAPGQYRVMGQRNGYLDGFYGARRPEGNGAPVTLHAGQQINDLRIPLTPSSTIAGAVHDADGEPMARITVTVHRLRFEEGRRRIIEVSGAYTDDLGQYRIAGLPPGKYYVFAQVGKANEFDSMTRPELVTEDHSAKAGARSLTLLSALYPGVQDPATARTVEVSPGARVTGVDIALTRTGTVSVRGRISAPPGMRVSGIKLDDVNSDNGQLGLHLVATAGKTDEFEFHEVPPGNYVLTASAGIPFKAMGGTVEMFPEDFKARLPLRVGTSPVENVRLIMAAGADIEGHVTVAGDDKADLSGNQMILDDGLFDPDDAMIDANNNFKLTLPVGHYTVHPNFAAGDLVVRSIEAQGKNVLEDGFTVSGPGAITLAITMAHDGGQLEGVVADAADKTVAGATVVLVPQGKLRTRSDLFQQRETDQYGRFHMDGIVPGDYKVFGWDDVEPGMWWDPEFLKKYEGVPVTIAPKSAAAVKVHLAKD